MLKTDPDLCCCLVFLLTNDTLARSCSAILQHNTDWQKDPSASLNFPHRAGEEMKTPGPDPQRWGAAFAQWAGTDMVMARSQTGVVTPGARSSSVGGEASTPSKEAKITPFHAKLMVASHHPIPSRSYYPSGLTMRGCGSDAEDAAQPRGAVSKMLDLKGLAEACSAHASASSSLMSLLPALKQEDPAEARLPSQRQLDSPETATSRPVALVGVQAGKHPSPSNL